MSSRLINNPYKIPAEEHFSKIHRKATQFGILLKVKPEDYEKYLCPCCNLPYNTQSISFCEASLDKIGQVSLRSKEYFQILIFFFIVLLVLFVSSSVPQFIFIPQISNCFLSFCFNEITHLGLYYNNINKLDGFKYQSPDFILFCSIIIIFALKYCFFWFLVKQNKDFNKKTNFIKHYSVHVHNLKAESEDQIKEEIIRYYQDKTFKFLTNNKINLKSADIAEISLIKDVSSIHNLIFTFIKLIKQYKIDKRKGIINDKKAQEIKQKMKDTRDKIIQVKSARYLNEAFVTFDNNHIPQTILTSKWKLLYKKYITKDIFFTKAMDPQDIIWENFCDSDWSRLLKYILSFFISSLIILGK